MNFIQNIQFSLVIINIATLLVVILYYYFYLLSQTKFSISSHFNENDIAAESKLCPMIPENMGYLSLSFI